MMLSRASSLRLALSSALPLILVVYVAWQGGIRRGDTSTVLYAIWSSAQNGGQGGYEAPAYGQQASSTYATSPYYNAVNTAELSADVNPYDAAALQYSAGAKVPVQNQMQTLHALASAKRLFHQIRAPATSYNSVMTQRGPEAALQSLQSKQYAGSAASKQIAQASLAIQQVLEQSKADHQLASAASRSAKSTKDSGASWNSLLSRESGPHKAAMASDWLATAVVTSKSTHSKAKYARAQLEAALSQVDGHYSHDAEAGAWHNEKRQRNSELRAMSNLAHAVMFKALSGQDSAPSSAVAPMAATSWVPPSSPSTSSLSNAWSSNSAGAGYAGRLNNGGRGSSRAGGEGGGGGGFGGGGGPSGGKSAMKGAAPGLSSYDAQILANGPPS